MKWSIPGKSLINVNNVESVLVKEETLGHMKGSTLGKSLINVNNVESVLVK